MEVGARMLCEVLVVLLDGEIFSLYDLTIVMAYNGQR